MAPAVLEKNTKVIGGTSAGAGAGYVLSCYTLTDVVRAVDVEVVEAAGGCDAFGIDSF